MGGIRCTLCKKDFPNKKRLCSKLKMSCDGLSIEAPICGVCTRKLSDANAHKLVDAAFKAVRLDLISIVESAI